ncbi:MAG TPA: GNAT family N-acetyltransferase [Streptosporangiaceae bacterium]
MLSVAAKEPRAVITVSPAQPDDVAAVASLLEDLNRFYGVPESGPPERRRGQVAGALFGEPPSAHALLARDGDRVAGLATYSFLWPSVGPTRLLFMKELYVPEAYRRQGVGRLLMRAVFETAAGLGCVRVEWTTDPGNAAARAFYEELGVPVHPKVFYRVTDTGSGFPLIG